MVIPPSAPSVQPPEIQPKAVLKTTVDHNVGSYQRPTSGTKRTENEINDALEFSKFAVAALKVRVYYSDIDLIFMTNVLSMILRRREKSILRLTD